MIKLESFVVNENLKSHDAKQLQKKIKEYFPSYKFDFYSTLEKKSLKNKYDKKSFLIGLEDYAEMNKIKKDEKFISLLQFYNYYITKEFYDSFVVSPLYSENVTEQVKKNKHLYHFTTGNNKESILKNGLRSKNGEYRYFPKRVYLYSTDKNITPKNINDDKDIEEFVKKILNKFDIDEYGVTIFEIDKEKLSNIDFYTDDYMDEKESVFIYSNIPAEAITKK